MVCIPIDSVYVTPLDGPRLGSVPLTFPSPAFAEASAGKPDMAGSGIFYPGEELGGKTLFESLQKIFETLQGLELETQTIKEKIVTIEEKMQEIIKRLESETETVFTRISNAKTRAEIIVVFLAILHLAREQLVFLEQASHFGDIVIKKSESKSKNEVR